MARGGVTLRGEAPFLLRLRLLLVLPSILTSEQAANLSSPRPTALVLSMALPDGLGDVIFGECAATELAEAPADVTWVRVYSSQASLIAGEAILAGGPWVESGHSFAFASPELFAAELGRGRRLDLAWEAANETFLAPWIFGIYPHDDALLALARRSGRRFFALSEYGRGMGPIQDYTVGLGVRVPTGWPDEDVEVSDYSVGVFKTLLRQPRSSVDWPLHFAQLVGARADDVRLWWFYNRKDSALVHEFRVLAPPEGNPAGAGLISPPDVIKLVPVTAEGHLAMGSLETIGELLGQALSARTKSSTSGVGDSIRPPQETLVGIAAQLSQLLVTILTAIDTGVVLGPQAAAEVIVAPNLLLSERANSSVVRVVALELISNETGMSQRVNLVHPIFLVAEPIPRAHMRSFLEACQPPVVATGDQSVVEALLVEKYPFARPDAKVVEWERAVAAARVPGGVAAVPDLGARLRELLASAEARERAARWSARASNVVAERIQAKLGAAAKSNREQQIMIRAGMFG